MIENLGTIDVQSILDCYHKLEPNIIWSDYGNKKQTSLQYKEGDNVWLSSSGKSKGDELSYDQLNPFFKDTVFEEIIKTYNLKRTRLMWVSPQSCYSMHVDSTPRIHVPMITYPDSFFVFKHRPPIHLSTGNVYKVETRLPHTFMNCSSHSRLHLIGAVEK